MKKKKATVHATAWVNLTDAIPGKSSLIPKLQLYDSVFIKFNDRQANQEGLEIYLWGSRSEEEISLRGH